MAEVDFSNARIEPCNVVITSSTNVNPTKFTNVSLWNNPLYIYSVSQGHTTAIGNGTETRLTNQQKQLVYLYQGTFSASGTEFYILNSDSSSHAGWKISNISFNSGDTFVFKIRADLICQ